MEFFNNDKPIYLQMADRMADAILAGEYADDTRIPSVREYAAEMQVNVNTAVKTYDELSRLGIIYQRRGMGYFVTAGARSAIQQQRREEFFQQRLPQLFKTMRLLDISIEEIDRAWRESEK